MTKPDRRAPRPGPVPKGPKTPTARPTPRGGRIFPRRLRRMREEHGWSQADLAARAGLQQSALSHYENATRRPSFANLRRLARALDVSTDYLVGHAPEAREAASRPSRDLAAQIERLSPADRETVRALVTSLLRKRA